MCDQCVRLEDASDELSAKISLYWGSVSSGSYALRRGDRVSWYDSMRDMVHVDVVTEVMTTMGGTKAFFRVHGNRDWQPEHRIVDPLPPKDPFAFDEWQQRYYPKPVEIEFA